MARQILYTDTLHLDFLDFLPGSSPANTIVQNEQANKQTE